MIIRDNCSIKTIWLTRAWNIEITRLKLNVGHILCVEESNDK